MQTREQLYDVISYHEFERQLDRLFAERYAQRHESGPA
jgi:hypothetical protein